MSIFEDYGAFKGNVYTFKAENSCRIAFCFPWKQILFFQRLPLSPAAVLHPFQNGVGVQESK